MVRITNKIFVGTDHDPALCKKKTQRGFLEPSGITVSTRAASPDSTATSNNGTAKRVSAFSFSLVINSAPLPLGTSPTPTGQPPPHARWLHSSSLECSLQSMLSTPRKRKKANRQSIDDTLQTEIKEECVRNDDEKRDSLQFLRRAEHTKGVKKIRGGEEDDTERSLG